MKKIFTCILVLVLGIMSAVPTYALEKNSIPYENVLSDADVKIQSKEYPNAYIEQKFTKAKEGANTALDSDGKVLVGSIDATVYVEEEYDIVDDKLEVTDSRLLTKEEVVAIGKDKFSNGLLANSQEATISALLANPQEVAKTEHNLTLRFSLYQYGSLNQYQLYLDAAWNAAGSLDHMYSSGKDFIGFTWGGGFDHSAAGASGSLDRYKCTPTISSVAPNKGIVWTFDKVYKYPLDTTRIPLRDVCAWTDIHKNKLTGGGNTTTIVGEYIHTWQSVVGSISVGAGGAAYTLSNTTNQWSVILSINKIKY